MDIGSFNKIVIVSLCDSYTKILAKTLSQNLGMIFCDTKDLIEYELIDKKAIEKMCSTEYLKNSEKKVIDHIASFVNVVVSINFDYLVHNFPQLEKSSLIVFINLSQKFVKENGNVIDSISYENRTKELQQKSNVVICLKKTEINFAINKVLNELGGLL